MRVASPDETIVKKDLFDKKWPWILVLLLHYDVYGQEDFEEGDFKRLGWSAKDVHYKLPKFVTEKEDGSMTTSKSTYDALRRAEDIKSVKSRLCENLAHNGKKFWWLTEWGKEKAEWLRPRLYVKWKDKKPFTKVPEILKE